MAAQYAAVLEQHADQLSRNAFGTLRLECTATDEVSLGWIECDRPTQTRLERRDVLIHIVTVQIHAGFQPQSVTRTQTALCDAVGAQRSPECGRGLRRKHDFETILAGVARA